MTEIISNRNNIIIYQVVRNRLLWRQIFDHVHWINKIIYQTDSDFRNVSKIKRYGDMTVVCDMLKNRHYGLLREKIQRGEKLVFTRTGTLDLIAACKDRDTIMLMLRAYDNDDQVSIAGKSTRTDTFWDLVIRALSADNLVGLECLQEHYQMDDSVVPPKDLMFCPRSVEAANYLKRQFSGIKQLQLPLDDLATVADLDDSFVADRYLDSKLFNLSKVDVVVLVDKLGLATIEKVYKLIGWGSIAAKIGQDNHN
ncbi:hypothetical protein DFA_10221 [Cavenderia fasciculata]|uniref:Uncharacterized protein n=1 Tax=Cavenderia fasciculata TaxID=261658 RepID=F4Q9L8_CACFS|nr:uncharacterized protein DFA_10221 [Cavenderia fasciculata]EGG15387.1 hypothetical protein DFA_10221 [Cavenderia fasciculata]|eukprot:XP_004354129.1 hypothetical protein DFA_10221 [Cavenderia fasciculata]